MMFYQPDKVIYLWMLPVVALVILPALWGMTRLLYQVVEGSRLVDVRGFIEVVPYVGDDQGGPERRKSPRIRIEGPKANVARKINCCRTYVANISREGICLTNIPRRMYLDDDPLRVVFRTRERNYSMTVAPRWKMREQDGYMLGGQIVSIPAGWEQFVNSLCRQPAAEAA